MKAAVTGQRQIVMQREALLADADDQWTASRVTENSASSVCAMPLNFIIECLASGRSFAPFLFKL